MKKIPFTLAVAVLCFLLGMLVHWKGCGSSGGIVVKTDTVVKVVKDNTPTHTPASVQTTPPSMAKDQNTIQWYSPAVIYRIDSSVIKDWIAATYAMQASRDSIYAKYTALYNLCASTNHYDSIYKLSNGEVHMQGKVQGNLLKDFNLSLLTRNTTITNTQKAKQRNSVWLGVDGLYRDSSIAVGASLMFQHKRGWAIESGILLNQHGGKEYRIGYKRNSFK